MQEIVDRHASVGGEKHGRTLAVPFAERVRSNTIDLLREQTALFHPFERQERGHHLGDGRGHEAAINVALVQYLSAGRIEQIGNRRILHIGNPRSHLVLRTQRCCDKSRRQQSQRNQAVTQVCSRAGREPRPVSRVNVSEHRYNRARAAWRAPVRPVHGL